MIDIQFKNDRVCKFYIGFENNELDEFDCSNLSDIRLERRIVSNKNILSFQLSVENPDQVYIVSSDDISLY